MVQKLNNVAAGAVMDEQELDFVSGGSRAESKELVALIEMHWPGVYHKYTTTFGGIGSDCEKMLAHWVIGFHETPEKSQRLGLPIEVPIAG